MILSVDDMQVELRAGTIDDVPLLLSFIRSMAAFEKLTVTATEASLQEALFGPEPAAHALLAFVDGEPIAYATYFFTFATMVGKRGLWLDDVFVTPAVRGKGVGKAIMAYLGDVAIRNRCSRLEWMVLDWNETAIAFYDRLGATILPDWRICRLEEAQLHGLSSRAATSRGGEDATSTDEDPRAENSASRELGDAVIYLIGIPAVGKYTIAKEISRLTRAVVVDNQLINLPVFSIVGYDGKDSFPFPRGAWEHVETIREAVFSVVRDCSPPGRSFIFTNVLEAGLPDDESLFRKIKQLAADRGADFFPVWLTCDAETIQERKDSLDRRLRFKDTDVTNVARYVEEFALFEAPHPNALRIDTSEESIEANANRIIDHVLKLRRR